MKPRGEKGKERPIKSIWWIHRCASIKLSPMRGRVQYATRHLSVWFSQLNSTDSATSGHPSTLFSFSRVWCAKTINGFIIRWKKISAVYKREKKENRSGWMRWICNWPGRWWISSWRKIHRKKLPSQKCTINSKHSGMLVDNSFYRLNRLSKREWAFYRSNGFDRLEKRSIDRFERISLDTSILVMEFHLNSNDHARTHDFIFDIIAIVSLPRV